VVQITTQGRFPPTWRTASGAASWTTAPTSSGTLATSPATSGPSPRASTKAPRYISPQPTITQ
jgi:hypothetical protein